MNKYPIIYMAFLLLMACAESNEYANIPDTITPYSQSYVLDSTNCHDCALRSSLRYINLNFGNDPVITAMSWTDFAHNSPRSDGRSLIKFRMLDSIDYDNINAITLTLYAIEDHPWGNGGQYGDNSFYICPVTETWNEHEVTWNTQPSFDCNEISIEVPRNNDYDSTVVDIYPIISEFQGLPNGIILLQDLEVPYRSRVYHSCDSEIAGKRPRLTIHYNLITTYHLYENIFCIFNFF